MNGGSDRLEKLQRMLDKQPEDPFVLYGIGMEYRKLDQPDKALEHFNRVIDIDPTYLYAYYQRGQVHELLGDAAAARQAYRDGIAAAERAGDSHVRDELSAALEMLE